MAPVSQPKQWWAPVWKGLVMDPQAKHYRQMKNAVWLYLYFLLNANRGTGVLMRKIRTISSDMGISRDTTVRWLAALRTHGYVATVNTGRSLTIQVTGWKPLSGAGKTRWQQTQPSNSSYGKLPTPWRRAIGLAPVQFGPKTNDSEAANETNIKMISHNDMQTNMHDAAYRRQFNSSGDYAQPESLAHELAQALGDPSGIHLYRSYCSKYPEWLLRKVLAITMAANREHVLARLTALVHQYESARNRLAIRDATAWVSQWEDDPFPDIFLWREAIRERDALAPGMLISACELAGFVHLPHANVPAERLLRVETHTSKPPQSALNNGSVVIGRNIHRGQARRVAIPPELRSRHCYIAGATGTGKSTLLTNLMVQDIAAGRGVGLLDPHGDLVKAMLRHIPENRIAHVILFDAADVQFPFALNILDAHDETERERIVAETIMALERYFPASWGPRLERILQYTLRTVLHAVHGATLADVEQMLTDREYREAVLAKTTDAHLLSFWNTQFPFLPKNACDPVLNKLSVFLLDRNVRNIICQRRSAIDFDDLLNSGKILLANLSTGLLTEKVSGTLGSFLVTKIVNAAFRRAGLPPAKRRPWFLYIDEFQNFVNLSVGFERILAEARKQALILTAANQHIGQLSPAVRQAIFGNVGTLVTFRLGVEDAHTIAKELGVFTAQDILSLELGQAIARAGGSATAFNLQTFPEPPARADNPTRRIVALARKRYAKPRPEVEKELGRVEKAAEHWPAGVDGDAEPHDPCEDDLVM